MLLTSGRATALRQHSDAPCSKLWCSRSSRRCWVASSRLRLAVAVPSAAKSRPLLASRLCARGPRLRLTETCCSATVQPVDDGNIDGVAGAPLTSIEIRLESCDITDRDGKPYKSTDTSHLGQKCCGRGEVQMRGTPVTAGYFKQPDKTAEVFTEDGWFRREMWGCGAPTASCRSSIG